MPGRSEYHGIVIQESIRDPTVLYQMKILGTKTGKKWTLLKIEVEPRSVDETIRLIQTNLLSEKGAPYYAYLYRGDELIVVFPERTFRVSPDKNSWSEAVSYGESLNVPRTELDFRPCRFKDETF
jgi:hypothetical protein